ncbi:MAG: AMP-binding protein [Bacteroidetes bacterium]|nr:AMP-binding protein [Bacteroidota bacterium]
MGLAPVILEPSKRGILGLPASHPEYTLFRRLWENWFSDEPLMPFFTSGSTGAAKELRFSREQVQASARLTQEWLSPQQAKRWLLCLPLTFVAGRMVLYRALVSQTPLQVMPPSAQPIQGKVQAELVSFTPTMLHAILNHADARSALSPLQGILLGGGPLSPELQQAILHWAPAHTQIWHTYGMTETLTHVAARELFPKSETTFRPISNCIHWEMTELGLKIVHPALQAEPIQTGDAGEIEQDGSFRWTGRMDSMLKVGGKKVWPEELEHRLQEEHGPGLPRFYFTGIADSVYGQRLVLVMEKAPENRKKLQQIFLAWHGSERPRYWALRPADFNAETGKTARAQKGLEPDLKEWEAD